MATPLKNAPKKHRILFVEDDLHILEWIRTILRLKNFDVETLSDGAQVLDYVLKERPDLVIMDVMIPLPNGYQLCHELKSREETRDTPIIFVTGLRTEKEIEEDKEENIFAKPVKLEPFLNKVREALGD